YPLFHPSSTPISASVARLRSSRLDPVRAGITGDSLTFAGVDEVFSNVSVENRRWLARYQKIIGKVSNVLQVNVSVLPILPSLTSLPRQFVELTGAPSY